MDSGCAAPRSPSFWLCWAFFAGRSSSPGPLAFPDRSQNAEASPRNRPSGTTSGPRRPFSSCCSLRPPGELPDPRRPPLPPLDSPRLVRRGRPLSEIFEPGPSRPKIPADLPEGLRRSSGRFLSKKGSLVLFAAAVSVYSPLRRVLVGEGVTFSGDEPNYLLTAHSLVYDQDINVWPTTTPAGIISISTPEKDNPRLKMGIYAREGKRGQDHIYPINLPGISALMVPFYAAEPADSATGFGRTFILKISLAIWAVLLGLQLYLLARDLWHREGLALGMWAALRLQHARPFLRRPSLPRDPDRPVLDLYLPHGPSGRPLSNAHLAFFGLLLGSFFWFGLKYNLIFWPLLAVAVFYLWTSHRLARPDPAGSSSRPFSAWPLSISPSGHVRHVLALRRL